MKKEKNSDFGASLQHSRGTWCQQDEMNNVLSDSNAYQLAHQGGSRAWTPNGISLNQTVPEKPLEWKVHKDRVFSLSLTLESSTPKGLAHGGVTQDLLSE